MSSPDRGTPTRNLYVLDRAVYEHASLTRPRR